MERRFSFTCSKKELLKLLEKNSKKVVASYTVTIKKDSNSVNLASGLGEIRFVVFKSTMVLTVTASDTGKSFLIKRSDQIIDDLVGWVMVEKPDTEVI